MVNPLEFQDVPVDVDYVVFQWKTSHMWLATAPKCHQSTGSLCNTMPFRKGLSWNMYRKSSCYWMKYQHKEYWWSVLRVSVKCKHNRLDSVVWDGQENVCIMNEVICPTDMNGFLNIHEKEDNYGRLLQILRLLYLDYKFAFISILFGVLVFFLS